MSLLAAIQGSSEWTFRPLRRPIERTVILLAGTVVDDGSIALIEQPQTYRVLHAKFRGGRKGKDREENETKTCEATQSHNLFLSKDNTTYAPGKPTRPS